MKFNRVWDILDLLTNPVEFTGYALFRQDIAARKSLSYVMEVDLLGVYLKGANRALLEAGDTHQFRVLYHAEKINLYFTDGEAGEIVNKPRVSIPEFIVKGIGLAVCEPCRGWCNIVAAVSSQTEKNWNIFENGVGKWKRSGSQVFVWKFRDPSFSIVLSRSEGESRVPSDFEYPGLFISFGRDWSILTAVLVPASD